MVVSLTMVEWVSSRPMWFLGFWGNFFFGLRFFEVILRVGHDSFGVGYVGELPCGYVCGA